jgi:hypothetical protein
MKSEDSATSLNGSKFARGTAEELTAIALMALGNDLSSAKLAFVIGLVILPGMGGLCLFQTTFETLAMSPERRER